MTTINNMMIFIKQALKRRDKMFENNTNDLYFQIIKLIFNVAQTLFFSDQYINKKT